MAYSRLTLSNHMDTLLVKLQCLQNSNILGDESPLAILPVFCYK